MDNKIDCSIILDLLPLYHDHVVSEKTKIAIKHHLESCESCKEEYELISENLPRVSENTTKEKFANMMKKQKQKRIISFILAVILACGLIGGGIYTLTVPCLVDVPQDEIKILRVYKYTDTDSPNNQDVFWVLGTTSAYKSPTSIHADIIVSQDGKSANLKYTMKIPVINQRSEDKLYNCLNSNLMVYDEYKNIETLSVGGKTVWTKGTEAPNYVYAKHSDDVILWDYDVAQGIIRVEYKNGDFIHWDLDGNIVSKGNYNNHEN